MLLMQNPELLLVDEPVAGMTPQEIERTAELLLSLAGEHSVVVVEHDMDFVRSIAQRVTVLHEGRVIAEGDMDQGAERPSRDRSLSRSVSVLAVKGLNQFYGGSHTLWDVDLTVPAGARMCLMGRNGMGKTTLLKCIMGLLHVEFRQHHIRRNRFAEVPRRAAGQARHRLRAARARDFFASDRGGKSARRSGRAQERRPDHSRRASSTCFPC